MERPLDLQSPSSGFRSMFWPPFALLKNRTRGASLPGRLQGFASAGPAPSAAPAQLGRTSPCHPSPSGLCISLGTEPGWEGTGDGWAGCSHVPLSLSCTWWGKLAVPTPSHQSLFRSHTWNWELESICSCGSWFIIELQPRLRENSGKEGERAFCPSLP